MSFERTYLHVDLDAFFASVEQHDNPELKGKPVIIGGLPEDRRAVVSTASYEARKYGVHSAMPIKKAYELCPNGIYIRGNYERYSHISNIIMSIFKDFSPDVIQMSIDEAFIDVTGTEKLFGSAEDIAKKIKERVFQETGLTVSIGISSFMYVAKIASGYKKPDGLTVIPGGQEEQFMLSLPLSKLWGAGDKTQERLKNAGIRTMTDIWSKSASLLCAMFGDNMGNFLYNAVRGNAEYKFGSEVKNHSISQERTFEFDLKDLYTIESALMEIARCVLWRMYEENVRSRTVAVKVRYGDFTTFSIQETFENYITNADDLYERARNLFLKKYDGECGIRLLGITCDKLESKELPVQKELFNTKNEKKARLEKAIFEMEKTKPGIKMQKARSINITGEEQNIRSHRDRNG